MADFKISTPPLLSWDIAQFGYRKLMEQGLREQDHSNIRKLAMKHNWKNDIDKILKNPFEALVLTDSDQVITWVNPGFQAMTGYDSKFALGKTPKFLQGKATSLKSRQHIRERLSLEEPVSETLVNYRKNGNEYTCSVKIIPLFNKQNILTHYLALEREVA